MLTTHSLSTKKISRSNNFAIAKVSYSALADILKLPKGYDIVGVEDEFLHNVVLIKITSTNVDDKPEGSELPVMNYGDDNWNQRIV
jgi:hypothetical protein